EGLSSREVKGTVKFGGGSLMVRACIGEVEGRMDAEQYVAILEGRLLQSMQHSGISADDDPKHTSRRTQIWFEKQDIKLLDWPTQFPDPDPIEHT
ncbi:hypothetical protein PAXRUDRAFT_145668, partial [Paxillus rubicundulus Ve08.2h10]